MASILWKGVVQLFRHAQDFADNKHMHKKGRVHTRSTVVSGTGAGHQHPGRTICGTAGSAGLQQSLQIQITSNFTVHSWLRSGTLHALARPICRVRFDFLVCTILSGHPLFMECTCSYGVPYSVPATDNIVARNSYDSIVIHIH